MRRILFLTIVTLVGLCGVAEAQSIQHVKQRMGATQGVVNVVEQPDAETVVKAVEGRTHRTHVQGYTILLFSDNSPVARENAFKAKEAFELNFRGKELEMFYESPSFYVTTGAYITMEEAVVELNVFRSIFPKAILQTKEFELKEFAAKRDISIRELRRQAQQSPKLDTLAVDSQQMVIDTLVGRVFQPDK